MAWREVMVFGVFNVVHPGHIRLFRFARELGERLVVGVLSDDLSGEAAHLSQHDRLEAVRTNELVDECMLVTSRIEDVLIERRPSVVVKGKEYEHRDNVEERIVSSYGGRLVFSSGESLLSSRDLIARELGGSEGRSIRLPDDFMRHHGVSSRRLDEIVDAFSSISLGVAGDLIIDEYVTCEPIGMSREEPTLVVTPIEIRRFVGGAGIVAAHAASLGARSVLHSVVGDDTDGTYCREELSRLGVEAHLAVDDARPTTVKQRFRAEGRSLLRVSRLSQQDVSVEHQETIYGGFARSSGDLDGFIFSDFNYGCLPTVLVGRMIDTLKSGNAIVSADSQSSSQVGDLTRFRGADLITPTEREARVALRNQSDGLVVIAEELGSLTASTNVLLKLGNEGLLVNTKGSGSDRWRTDRLPALNPAPRDVAGAGDSLLVCATLALAAGASIWEAACIGSIAAAVQVSRVGNVPLRGDELRDYLT
jgi:rfaE bifunctional protein kinase chain/domain